MIVAFVDERGVEFSNLLHTNVAETLKNAGASLWTVTIQARNQNMGGGFNSVVLTPQALDGAFASVADQILGRLAVTYVRPEALVPPERIDVTVKRPDVKLRVPRWAAK